MKTSTLLLASLLIACQTPPQSSPPTTSPPPTTATPSPDTTSPPPEIQAEVKTEPLPPGVLAQAQGQQGLIRVEEVDGLRLLTITDAQGFRGVHAAVSQEPGVIVGPDPVVGLALMNRPKAKRALVIGLGSGRTATDLMAAGFVVEAVELEPVVIEFARAWFGYKGNAVAAEGAAYLAQRKGEPFDIVLLDAFDGQQKLPPQFLSATTLEALHNHLSPGGVLFTKLLTKPSDPVLNSLTHMLSARHSMVLGSGVGDEPQNLLVIASESPLSADIPADAALWPVHLPGDVSDASSGHALETRLDPTIPQGVSASVSLVGYLTKLPDGQLALDLPHWHMGARRYVLRGPEPFLTTLEAALPPKATFPTSGDIGSDADGDLNDTLQHLLGGGGVKRSQLKFSPVVASVQGKAKLRAVVGPDHVAMGRLQNPPESFKLIPYGGILYDLELSSVAWTLDDARWQALRAKHIAPALKKVVATLTKSGTKTEPFPQNFDLKAALAPVSQGIEALCVELPGCEQLTALQELRRLIPDPKSPPLLPPAFPPSDLDALWIAARACDIAQHGQWSPYSYETFNPDARLLGLALQRCAERAYVVIAKHPTNPIAPIALGRLLGLSDAEPPEDASNNDPPPLLAPITKPNDLKKLMGSMPSLVEPLDAPP